MQRIVVTDHHHPNLNIERETLVEEDGPAELTEAQAETAADVIDAADGADALLNTYAPITADVFDALDSLEVVGRYGVGVDNVDVKAASEHGVRVVNVPDYCTDEVPEHALAMILACERGIGLYDRQVRDGGWDWKAGAPLYRLRGRTLGVAGMGAIPRNLVEKTRNLGFDYVAYDPYVPQAEMPEEVEKVDFEGFLERSDVVSIHTPLTEETENLFDAAAFERMRESATLVNTSRGPVVDTDALVEALEADELRAVGLDVLPTEPPEDPTLLDRDDVVLSPHVAWYSEESIVEQRRSLASDIRAVLRGEEPENQVNRDAV